MIDLSWIIDPVYIATIFFFIIGLHRIATRSLPAAG